MPVDYTVHADVVDLTRVAPRAGQTFLVDTNIWFWTAYPSAPDAPQTPREYQLKDYANFLKKVLVARGKLFCSGLSWSELAHTIEATEFKAAKEYSGVPQNTNPKEYRHNFPEERKRVVGEIENAWLQVLSMATPLDSVAIGTAAVNQGRKDIADHNLDGYDLFLVQALRASGLTGIITDDGDFCTAKGITIFTANQTVTSAARRQGRLLNR